MKRPGEPCSKCGGAVVILRECQSGICDSCSGINTSGLCRHGWMGEGLCPQCDSHNRDAEASVERTNARHAQAQLGDAERDRDAAQAKVVEMAAVLSELAAKLEQRGLDAMAAHEGAARNGISSRSMQWSAGVADRDAGRDIKAELQRLCGELEPEQLVSQQALAAEALAIHRACAERGVDIADVIEQLAAKVAP